MPTFGNREASPQNSKPGDYILRVIGFDKGLSTGAKTSGATKYELKCLVESTGSLLVDNHVFADNEYFQSKLDCFLKSCGVVLREGEAFDFDQEDCDAFTRDSGKPCKFIPLIGLRGWATIGMKKPQNAGDVAKWNEVMVWLTNKEKLPRHTPPAPVETPAENPAWGE